MIRLSHIVEATAQVTGHGIGFLKSTGRKQPLAHARQVGFVAASQFGFSQPDIGRAFGGRDHSTVAHGIAAVSDRSNITEARHVREIRLLAMKLAEEISAAPFKSKRVDPCVFRSTRNRLTA